MRPCLILAIVFLACGMVRAQDPAPVEPAPAEPPAAQPPAAEPPATQPPAPPAAQPDAAAKPGEKAAAFGAIFAQWKKLLSELYALKVEYGSANADRKAQIRTRFDELVQQGRAMEPKVEEAAEAAYVEAPKADPQVEEFLWKSCLHELQADDYEAVAHHAKLLLDGGSTRKELPLCAGVAAFCTNDVDAARNYLNLARDKGVKIQTGKDYFDNVLAQFLDDPTSFKKRWEKEQAIREAEAKADDLPRVLFKTERGDVELELFENEAPVAVANFISLVEKGFYKDVGFHRVLPGFMAQGGDPKGDGTGGPGYTIPCECQQPNHREHFRGSLSMAHAGRDTGGSQFFLTFVPTVSLDGVHTVFGRVIKGMDVLAKIQRRDPEDRQGTLPRPDRILEAKVLRKRPHEYVPTKSNPGKQ